MASKGVILNRLSQPLGSKYLSAADHTEVNCTGFVAQEDTTITLLEGGDASVAATDVDYKASMNLDGVTLKKGAFITSPAGEAFQNINISAGSVLAYNSVFKGIKPGSFVGLLDLYPNAEAAYSLRKLKADYTGAAIEVRRTVGIPTNQDIGFDDNGDLDTASLLSFVGSGDGFVAIWYDQSGEGNDATQGSADTQPKIVSGGTLESLNGKPSVNFINTGDKMNTTSPFEVSSNFTVFNSNAYSNVNYIFGSDAYTASGLISGGTSAGIDGITAFSNPNTLAYNDEENAAQRLVVLIQNENTNLDVNSAGLVSATNIGSMYAETIGNRAPTRSFSVRGNIQECIFFSDDKSATKADIETNINDYYNVY